MPLNVYLYPGFGDHCIAYGIIKEYSKIHETVYCYTDTLNEQLLNTRRRLFSGIKNVVIMDILYRKDIFSSGLFLGIAQMVPWFDVTKPWFENPFLPAPEWFDEDWQFDVRLYKQAIVPFNLKWDNFDFQRNLDKEKEVYYDILGLKDNEEFIFMHDDPDRNYAIDRKYINENLKLIDFCKLQNINVLDILYTIEKSKECHVVNTGTRVFVDQMGIKHDNLVYHQYTRPSIFEQPVVRLNWKVIL